MDGRYLFLIGKRILVTSIENKGKNEFNSDIDIVWGV